MRKPIHHRASIWLAAAVAVAGLVVPTATADDSAGMSTPNLQYVTSFPYLGGSDLEFQTRPDGRSFAYAGATADFGGKVGLRIVEITDPAHPVLRSYLNCNSGQNDVQVMERGPKTYVLLGSDYYASRSTCFDQLGISQPGSSNALGVVVVDVTDVGAPRAVGFVYMRWGAHNSTLHPGGRYAYVSDSELEDRFDGQTQRVRLGKLQIVDLADPTSPQFVNEIDLPLGASSHDVTFNADGSRAYSAALTQTAIIDSSDPAHPKLLTTILDPTVNIHHQADPFTVGDKDYLVVADELAGAAGNGFCPGGGLHIYDISNEAVPVPVGVFVIPELSGTFRCTSHVLRIVPEQHILTIAWYQAGTWVVDISDPLNFKAVGAFKPQGADTWAAKMFRGYIFTDDLERGMDVYRYLGPATPAQMRTAVRRINATAPVIATDVPPAPYFCFQLKERPRVGR